MNTTIWAAFCSAFIDKNNVSNLFLSVSESFLSSGTPVLSFTLFTMFSYSESCSRVYAIHYRLFLLIFLIYRVLSFLKIQTFSLCLPNAINSNASRGRKAATFQTPNLAGFWLVDHRNPLFNLTMIETVGECEPLDPTPF